jgi:hypothetical protein
MANFASDIPFVTRQVTICLRLADERSDQEIAEHLIKRATAFAQRALHLGACPASIPDIPIGSYRSPLPALTRGNRKARPWMERLSRAFVGRP